MKTQLRKRVRSLLTAFAVFAVGGSVAATATYAQDLQLIPLTGGPILSGSSQEQFEAQVATTVRLQGPQNSGIFQLGSNNQAGSLQLFSPGSTTIQSQRGNSNVSRAATAGGGANTIGVDQFGNNLDSTVVLLNSRGTEATHRQRGNGGTGGVLIINGYPGLRVQVR